MHGLNNFQALMKVSQVKNLLVSTHTLITHLSHLYSVLWYEIKKHSRGLSLQQSLAGIFALCHHIIRTEDPLYSQHGLILQNCRIHRSYSTSKNNCKVGKTQYGIKHSKNLQRQFQMQLVYQEENDRKIHRRTNKNSEWNITTDNDSYSPSNN